MQTQAHKICVLGSANVDSFVYVKHIPVPGQTIQADKYMIANGGKGANQAAAAGKLAGGCIFTGQVGSDDQMRNLKREMTQAGVTLLWKEIPDSTTGKAFIYVDERTGQNSIVIIGGANIAYDSLDALPQIYREAIDQCQILQLQKQIPMQINTLAAKYAKSKGKIVMLDCGGRDDEIPSQLLQNLDYISPNQTEVLRIDPNINVDNPVQQIRSKIISKYKNLKVILKLGVKGSTLITDKIHIHADVATKINPQCLHKYKIVDTVGAGDCFTSAFCVKLIQSDLTDETKLEQNYKQALIFGNCAAFLCITKKGAMPSMPNRRITDQFINQFNMFSIKKSADCQCTNCQCIDCKCENGSKCCQKQSKKLEEGQIKGQIKQLKSECQNAQQKSCKNCTCVGCKCQDCKCGTQKKCCQPQERKCCK